MHWEKGQVEADEDQPERPSPQALAHHPSGDLGKPVIDRAKQGKHGAADQHIMEMRYHEIGVMDLRIERN